MLIHKGSTGIPIFTEHNSSQMIESRYWKKDLLRYAKAFSPKKNPSKRSNKNQVNIEKDIVIAFFIIRKLAESHKFSPKINNYNIKIFRHSCVKDVNNRNYMDIHEMYDLSREEEISKKPTFVSNQLIHGGAMFAYRADDGNWEGIYTCSDFERQKYIYRIPFSEVVSFLKKAGKDYPSEFALTYNPEKGDYDPTTN